MKDLNEKWVREISLIGIEAFDKIKDSIFLIFGLGGVGGFALESLVRAGATKFSLIDYDRFDISNFNRQLEANDMTLGKFKTETYENRILSINQNIDILTFNNKIINEEFKINNNDEIYIQTIINKINEHFTLNNSYEKLYALDMIDNIYSKVSIIKYCYENNIKIISSMGTANCINSSNIKIDNIHNTRNCPVAKKIRNLIKPYNIKKLDVLYIDEAPIKKSTPPSTISYLPAICGLKMSEFVIKKIITTPS